MDSPMSPHTHATAQSEYRALHAEYYADHADAGAGEHAEHDGSTQHAVRAGPDGASDAAREHSNNLKASTEARSIVEQLLVGDEVDDAEEVEEVEIDVEVEEERESITTEKEEGSDGHEKEKKKKKSVLKRTKDGIKYSFISKETEEAFGEILILFEKMFDDFPYNKVDLMFGLMMLDDYYQNAPILTMNRVVDVEFIETARFYMKFAYCCYGWKFIYGILDRKTYKFVRSMVGVDANIKAIYACTGVEPKDVITTKFNSKVFDPGHYICLCHERKAIVVAFRGTFHIRDALTDLVAGNTPFMNGTAHNGLLRTAKNKYQALTPVILKCFQENPTYKVIVVGHSLGAGTASLFSLLFHEGHPDVPLHCYAYAPPGVVSPNIALSPSTLSLIDSIVLGTDIVPRLSFATLSHLKTIIMQILSKNSSTFQRARQWMHSSKLKEEEKIPATPVPLTEISVIPPGRLLLLVSHIESEEKGEKEREKSEQEVTREIKVEKEEVVVTKGEEVRKKEIETVEKVAVEKEIKIGEIAKVEITKEESTTVEITKVEISKEEVGKDAKKGEEKHSHREEKKRHKEEKKHEKEEKKKHAEEKHQEKKHEDKVKEELRTPPSSPKTRISKEMKKKEEEEARERKKAEKEAAKKEKEEKKREKEARKKEEKEARKHEKEVGSPEKVRHHEEKEREREEKEREKEEKERERKEKKKKRKEKRNKVYFMEYSNAALFNEIVISPSMFTCHMPSAYDRALENCLQTMNLINSSPQTPNYIVKNKYQLQTKEEEKESKKE